MTSYGAALILVAGGAVLALLVFTFLPRSLTGGSPSNPVEGDRPDTVRKLKAREEALTARAEASERLRHQIVESLTAGLLLMSRDGRIEILNSAGRRMLGVHGGVGADYRELLAALPPLVDVLSECLATGRPIVRSELHLPGAGGALDLGFTVSPLGDGDGPRGVICLFSDLTAVRELEERLRLKEALAQLGEMTAGIAHEFRNGLATIHGYGRLIEPKALPATYRPYVEGIRQETELLGRVVTNFLRFARPEQVVCARVDLKGLAERAIDDLRNDLPASATVSLGGQFGQVLGDEVLLRQMFGNLVRNAAEACETAGSVPVIAITGCVDRDQKACRVSVDDNGPGIGKEARERVFQPFFTTRSRGTGLGLSIVQKVIVLHNGRISVRESATGGASFLLEFPLAQMP